MEWLKEIFSNNAGMILTVLLSVVLTIFSKMIISIFKTGLSYKSKFCSQEQFDKTRADIRGLLSRTKIRAIILARK